MIKISARVYILIFNFHVKNVQTIFSEFKQVNLLQTKLEIAEISTLINE